MMPMDEQESSAITMPAITVLRKLERKAAMAFLLTLNQLDSQLTDFSGSGVFASDRELLGPDGQPGDHDQAGDHHGREERGDDADPERDGEAATGPEPSSNRISEAIK